MIKRNISWKRAQTVKRSYNLTILYRTNETNKKETYILEKKMIIKNNYEQPMKNK